MIAEKTLSFDETCKRLSKTMNMSKEDILNAIMEGQLNTYVKIKAINEN